MDHKFLVENQCMDLTDQIFLVESPHMDPKSFHFWKKSPYMDPESVQFWVLYEQGQGLFLLISRVHTLLSGGVY